MLCKNMVLNIFVFIFISIAALVSSQYTVINRYDETDQLANLITDEENHFVLSKDFMVFDESTNRFNFQKDVLMQSEAKKIVSQFRNTAYFCGSFLSGVYTSYLNKELFYEQFSNYQGGRGNFTGGLGIDETILHDLEFDLIEGGRLPSRGASIIEICIPLVIANQFLECEFRTSNGTITSLSDLYNEIIAIGSTNCRIVGIIDTDFKQDDYQYLSEGRFSETTLNMNTTLEKYLADVEYDLHTKVFLNLYDAFQKMENSTISSIIVINNKDKEINKRWLLYHLMEDTDITSSKGKYVYRIICNSTFNAAGTAYFISNYNGVFVGVGHVIIILSAGLAVLFLFLDFRKSKNKNDTIYSFNRKDLAKHLLSQATLASVISAFLSILLVIISWFFLRNDLTNQFHISSLGVSIIGPSAFILAIIVSFFSVSILSVIRYFLFTFKKIN